MYRVLRFTTILHKNFVQSSAITGMYIALHVPCSATMIMFFAVLCTATINVYKAIQSFGKVTFRALPPLRMLKNSLRFSCWSPFCCKTSISGRILLKLKVFFRKNRLFQILYQTSLLKAGTRQADSLSREREGNYRANDLALRCAPVSKSPPGEVRRYVDFVKCSLHF